MVQIRLAKESDADQIYDLNENALGYEYDKEKTTEKLHYILLRNTDKIWVAIVDEKIVGYIHGADYECTYAESLKNIMAIAVKEQYRGQGIGKKLLQAVEQWAKDCNCSGVRLVSGYNREKAHGFYLHCDYILRKNQKNFIKLFNMN